MNEQSYKILGMARHFLVRRNVHTDCGAQSAFSSYAYLIGDKAIRRGEGRERRLVDPSRPISAEVYRKIYRKVFDFQIREVTV